jgi:hypothetical protein
VAGLQTDRVKAKAHMSKAAYDLIVRIIRYVDDGFPGWVECEFADVDGRNHTIVDKVPAFTTDVLDSTSSYPRTGRMACKVVEERQDDQGREVVHITTDPYGIVSTEGLSDFVVLRAQLSEAEKGAA